MTKQEQTNNKVVKIYQDKKYSPDAPVDTSFGMCLVSCRFLPSSSNIPIRKVTPLDVAFKNSDLDYHSELFLISRLHLGCQRLGLPWQLVRLCHYLYQYWL